MKKKALVSIIMPVYNSEKTVLRAIKSVFNQTYTNWELILVDDGSTDRSIEIIHQIKDHRVRFLQLSKNEGAARARNLGISSARGKYIAFLDSDDEWLPQKLEKQIAFMEKKSIGFSFTAYKRIKQGQSHAVSVPSKISYHGLLKNTIIGCLTVVLDKEKIGPIKMPDIRTRQDMATWLSILKKGYCAYGLKEVLACYHVDSQSLSAEKIKMAKQTWKMYREQEKLNVFYAAYCFVHYAFHATRKRIKILGRKEI